MNNSGLSSWKIAGTYIGTVIGAGFASGQEILQFFSVHGAWGYIGIALATLLFILFGIIIIQLGSRLQAQSHQPIIRHIGGPVIGAFMDIIITFFLFGSLTTMLAGAGAMFKLQFGVSPYFTNAIFAVITALTVSLGIKGVINSISYIVPFLIASAIVVSICSFFITDTQAATAVISKNKIIGGWVWAAILYCSYNLVMAVSVIGPLGAQVNVKDKTSINKGAILGGIGLGIGALAICLALGKNMNYIFDQELPMIKIAGRISPIMQFIYSLALLCEVYTTAVGSLYGLTARFTGFGEKKWVLIVCSIAAYVASLLGFTNMVRYLFPVIGYCGLTLLVCLIISMCRDKFKINNRKIVILSKAVHKDTVN